MVASTFGCQESGLARCLGLFLVCLLVAAGVSQAQGGFLYQTRHTEHPPTVARHGHASVELGDGRVGIFGGFGRIDVEIFDPATEQFTPTRATRDLGDFAGVALLNGNALLVNGWQDCIFDYQTEQYVDTERPYAGAYIRFPVLVPLPDGKVFICGGYDTDFQFVGNCGLFDPRTLQFSPLGGLVVPRGSHTAVALDDARILVIGGSGGEGRTPEEANLDSLELYDVRTGTSSLVRTTLREARYEHRSVVLPDGRVLTLGGVNWLDDLFIRSTEFFDPRTATMVDGPMLGLGRRGARIATLPSGRIAVFGGNYDARTVEIYDPATGLFKLADRLLLDARWTDFTATRLGSGAVLLVGGRVNAGDEVVQNAEIFEEVATDTPSDPPMTLASIRQLLADSDPDVVAGTTDWLIALGPQVKPILQTLSEDESPEIQRLAGDIMRSIDAQDYPTGWCVEIWNAVGRLETLWLDNFECPDAYSEADPPAHVTAILQATGRADFSHLVVRFPAHASYENRVKLFNLVGWTGVPSVLLGESLSEDDLTRFVDR